MMAPVPPSWPIASLTDFSQSSDKNSSASTILVLPAPFGPTNTFNPGRSVMENCLSDLKPTILILEIKCRCLLLLLRHCTPRYPQRPLGFRQFLAAIGDIESLQYSKCALGVATSCHQSETHFGIVSRQGRRRQFLDKFVDTDAARTREISQACICLIGHLDG